MKIKSPVVTLLVGVVIAAIIYILSVNAQHTGSNPYGAAILAAVLR